MASTETYTAIVSVAAKTALQNLVKGAKDPQGAADPERQSIVLKAYMEAIALVGQEFHVRGFHSHGAFTLSAAAAFPQPAPEPDPRQLELEAIVKSVAQHREALAAAQETVVPLRKAKTQKAKEPA